MDKPSSWSLNRRIQFVLILSTSLLLVAFQQKAANSSRIKFKTISDTGFFANDTTPRLIAKQFSFTEGPAVNKEGDVFFTDQPNNKIWKYDTDGKLSVFMENAGRSNGMYFDRKGNLLTCADEHNQVWAIGKTKKVTVLVDAVSGKKLNGPNDLWSAPNGDVYFTDPYYQRPYWTRTAPEMDGEHVYLLRPGKEVVKVIGDLEQPNGIVGTPDGKYLYVADIKGGKTYRYSVAKDGSLNDRQLIVSMGSDGITLDDKGNLYLTGNGVTVIDPSGRRLAHITLPGWTSNVAFGGKNKDELFITCGEAIYTIKMNVHGVE